MTTGERIRQARKSAGMTQAELAHKLGISAAGIAQWENDLRNPKIETLRKLADALGVTSEVLLRGSAFSYSGGIKYINPEHEAAFLSELQRIPHIVNPESGRINPYWGASLYLLSALTRWPELRIAVIGEDYMAFTAAKEAFNLSQNERIVVELAAAFYNAGLWEMPGFEMVCATCDTAFALILEAFRLRRAKLFYKDGEVSAEWEERK